MYPCFVFHPVAITVTLPSSSCTSVTVSPTFFFRSSCFKYFLGKHFVFFFTTPEKLRPFSSQAFTVFTPANHASPATSRLLPHHGSVNLNVVETLDPYSS
eukprot:Lithocolla_globosa_v1_NODE_7986_length_877_cov_128.632603.p3 type:complete len:100 gc:universal NODE_7986_length_877_cov_128.632603:226-525(+)